MPELIERFEGVRKKVSDAFNEKYSEHGALDKEGKMQFKGPVAKEAAKKMYKHMMGKIIELEREIYTSEEFVKNPSGGEAAEEMEKLSKFKSAVFKSIMETGKLTDTDLKEIYG